MVPFLEILLSQSLLERDGLTSTKPRLDRPECPTGRWAWRRAPWRSRCTCATGSRSRSRRTSSRTATFKKILIVEVYQRRLNSLPVHQGLNSKNTLQYKGRAAILDIWLKFKVEKGCNCEVGGQKNKVEHFSLLKNMRRILTWGVQLFIELAWLTKFVKS